MRFEGKLLDDNAIQAIAKLSGAEFIDMSRNSGSQDSIDATFAFRLCQLVGKTQSTNGPLISRTPA